MTTYQPTLFAATNAAPIRDDVAALLPPELATTLAAAGLDGNRQGIAVRRYQNEARPSLARFAAICRELALDQAAPKQGPLL